MVSVNPPWQVHTLRNYRIYVLENPYVVATVKSPSVSNLEQNIKSLPILCRGGGYITHAYGSETVFPGEEPKMLWPGDYNISISDDARYCCVVAISEANIGMEYGIITEPKLFKAGQTLLLLDGQISINGYVYNQITQIDLAEDKTIITERAVVAWTVI